MPTPASRQAPARRAGVWVLALGTFAVGTDAFVVAGFLPAMSRELGVSVAAAGQSVTVFAISYAVLSPLIASVTATVPRRRLLIIALGVLAVANLLSAAAPTIAVLLMSRVLAAAGAAAYTPNAGVAAAAMVRPERRGRALATVIGGLTLATAVGVPVGALTAQVMGWRAALACVGVLSGGIALAVALSLPRLEGGRRIALRARFAVLRSPTVRRVLPVTVLGMAAAYTAYAYAIPAFAAVGIHDGGVQGMLLIYGVGAIVGAQLSGRLTDRFGGVRVLLAGYAVLAATLATLAGLSASTFVMPTAVGALALLWGASSWCQTPPQQHRLIDAVPAQAPLVIALNSSALYLGISLGTAIGGAVGSVDAVWMFLSGALLALLAGAHLLFTSRPRRREERSAVSGSPLTPDLPTG